MRDIIDFLATKEGVAVLAGFRKVTDIKIRRAILSFIGIICSEE